jgi:hypothetical protein
VAAADIAATRRTLLALVANLAADEAASLTPHRRIPSTRELSRLMNGYRASRQKARPRQRASAAPRRRTAR